MKCTQLSLWLGLAFGAVSLPALAAENQPLRSVGDIQKQVEALKKEDVAWRKIEWKTCLLDGLQASREQAKPVVLWVFIDRPIDDERC